MYQEGCGKSLMDLGLNVKKSECRLTCHLANGLSCEIKKDGAIAFLVGDIFLDPSV